MAEQSSPAAPLPFGVRLRVLRNRLLSQPATQRWVTRLPVLRWIARRRAREVFDLSAGFVYSQVLLACLRLELFPLLKTPATVADIAVATALEEAAARTLLRAAAAIKLIDCVGPDTYLLGERSAALLANPAACAMVQHNALLYRDLADPVALLRGDPESDRVRRFWAYGAAERKRCGGSDRPVEGAGAHGEGAGRLAAADAYTELMAASNRLVAEQLMDAVALQGARRVLDVGGGDGSFLRALQRRWPQLEVGLFDLPPVVELARRRFPGTDSAAFFPGDFARDPLPPGFDVVTLVRVLHDHNLPLVRTLLKKVFEALPPQGRLLIAEPMAGTRSAPTVGDAYFGWFFLAMGSGASRSADELMAVLRATGFRRVRRRATALPVHCSVIEAFRG